MLYRVVIPEARTKWEAEQAETKIERDDFENRFGQVDQGSEKLAEFIEKVYLPWSKANKRSWRHVFEFLSALCEKSTGRGYVFVNLKTGTRIREIKTGFRTALKMAGIDGLVWRDLRAAFVTRLGEAGFDAFTIAAHMGHSDIHTTARYVRATDRDKRTAVEAAVVGSKQVVHKLATQRQLPDALAVVSC